MQSSKRNSPQKDEDIPVENVDMPNDEKIGTRTRIPPTPQMPPLPSLSPNSDVKEELDESGPIILANEFYHSHGAYGINEFERFVAHQDFVLFLSLASKVKFVRKNLICGNVPDAKDVIYVTHIESKKYDDEVDIIAETIQSTLLFGANDPVSPDAQNVIFPKEICAKTDVLIEESIISLCREFNRCMTWYDSKKQVSLPRPPPLKKLKANEEPLFPTTKSSYAIVVKYSKWQTDILTNWMIENRVRTFFPSFSPKIRLDG